MTNELQTTLDNILEDKTTNLKPENLKQDVTVMGVTGTLKNLDTSDATATANDILNPKTAYVNGEKITGNILSLDGVILLVLEQDNPVEVDETGIIFKGKASDDGYIMADVTSIWTQKINNNIIASAIGLTANKIVAGNTILGVEGTATTGDDISNYITTNVTDTTFKLSNLILKVPEIDTTNVTNFFSAFMDCTKLSEVSGINTSNATNMQNMFRNCSNLVSISQIDSSKVTNMSYMFYNCQSLQSIPTLNTSLVYNMSYTFNNCRTITEIPQIDTKKVTYLDGTFSSCKNLVTIPILDLSNIQVMSGTFDDCPNLSDESLNNILDSIKIVTWEIFISSMGAETAQKTLGWIGLSQEQAQKCTTLSNWAACEEAGWTTGY